MRRAKRADSSREFHGSVIGLRDLLIGDDDQQIITCRDRIELDRIESRCSLSRASPMYAKRRILFRFESSNSSVER